jgi:hypothetical protein
MSASNSTKPSTISYGTTNSGRNSALILPDDYKFKGDGSDSHRWREVKDQVINKSMSEKGFKMTLLESKPVPDEEIYKNAAGAFTTSGKIALEKKKEEIEEKQMKVYGVLMKHIEPNSRAWAILGDLVKDPNPVAIFQKLKETYDADSTAGFFEIMEKFFEPPSEEDLLQFLNRKYKELTDFEGFGKGTVVNRRGEEIEVRPHEISETVKVLMVFAMARKVRKYAVEMDDFVTENLLNLPFDSVELQFSILYEKLVKFLRNREITGVSSMASESKDQPVFTTELFNTELNKALQRRENSRKRKDFKKKKFLGRHADKFGKSTPSKPKTWLCSVHGHQSDHSSTYCPTLHPELLEKKAKFQARNNPLHRVKDEEKEVEANVTLSKKPKESKDFKFEWGVNFVSLNCNLVTGELVSDRCIFDTGAGANVVNRFQRKLVRNFQPCQGNVIGAGGRIVGAIVGEGTIKVLGQEMPVYYGPDLPKSVFSIGVFTRDFCFEVWFKGNLCITWIPKHLVSKDRRDYEAISIGEDTLYDIPHTWFD